MKYPAKCAHAGAASRLLIYWLLPALAFAASRLAYRRLGVVFEWRTIDYYAQLLDPPLLKAHLLSSLWRLHAQPPAYNLLTGLALKVAPSRYPQLLSLVFMFFGLATLYLLVLIFRQLRFSPWAAWLLSAGFMALPVMVLYENWYFYPYPVHFFLVAAAWAFMRDRLRAGLPLALAFLALAFAALTRSVYPPVYCVGIVVLLGIFYARLGLGRRYAVLALVLFSPVLGWSLKNQILFGFFGTSSWGGISLHKSAVRNAKDLVPGLLASGRLHPLSTVPEFAPPEAYLQVLGRGRDTGIPALDRTGKSAPSVNPVNYNHRIYPAASRIYLRDALAIIRHAPARYARTVWDAWRLFWKPASSVLYGVNILDRRIAWLTEKGKGLESGWPVWLVTAFALAGVARAWRRGLMRPEEKILYLFIFATCAWVAAVTSLVEIDENNRMRFEIYGLHFIGVAGGLACWRGGLRDGNRGAV